MITVSVHRVCIVGRKISICIRSGYCDDGEDYHDVALLVIGDRGSLLEEINVPPCGIPTYSDSRDP